MGKFPKDTLFDRRTYLRLFFQGTEFSSVCQWMGGNCDHALDFKISSKIHCVETPQNISGDSFKGSCDLLDGIRKAVIVLVAIKPHSMTNLIHSCTKVGFFGGSKLFTWCISRRD